MVTCLPCVILVHYLYLLAVGKLSVRKLIYQQVIELPLSQCSLITVLIFSMFLNTHAKRVFYIARNHNKKLMRKNCIEKLIGLKLTPFLSL